MSAPSWIATSVALNVSTGNDDVAGWQYGELFIDFRAINPAVSRRATLPFCWVVSHVPTGLGVIGLFADRPGAQTIVESLWQVADWSKPRGRNGRPPAAVQEFLDLLPIPYCLTQDTIAPFTTVEYSKETVQ